MDNLVDLSVVNLVWTVATSWPSPHTWGLSGSGIPVCEAVAVPTIVLEN